ncbi:MAG TPA: GTP pyrophosphokinase family protein [Candidatus Aphodovivens avicola]|nr:GTP pyrophosphokinase family protein [Candidatus Aphodovivens avicola]
MKRILANGIESLEAALRQRFTSEESRTWIKEQSRPFRELMSYYRCALMEVETKFRVLNEELSLEGEANPIDAIESRLKSPESIIEKVDRKGIDFSVEAIEEHIDDIAGIRVICSFESDVYLIAEALLRQTDVQLIERIDYIANPKPSGYRSLHLVIAIPIFLYDEKKIMKVEVQLRTMAMDMWASLEHKLAYKKEQSAEADRMHANLLECAELSARIDKLMTETRDLAG